jgi:DNA (cytosine-5)-methyltransferase 1
MNRHFDKTTGRMAQIGLTQQVKLRAMWPTPNCPNGGRSIKHVTDWRGNTAYHKGKKVQVGLEAAVKLWPTPTAVTNSGGAAMCKWGGAGSRAKLKTMVTPQELNGALNPTWVEWLMGWPLEWTSCDVSATDKFRKWCAWHGISSVP